MDSLGKTVGKQGSDVQSMVCSDCKSKDKIKGAHNLPQMLCNEDIYITECAKIESERKKI